MKLFLAILVYTVAAGFLAYGMLQTVFGKPGLLIFGVLLYAVLLGGIGCLPKKSH
jgi:hypothetical protein